jgi:serine/threonine protein kinase
MIEPKVSDTVAGHRLLEKLGTGANGSVWKAEYLGQTVALKLYHGTARSDVRREAFAAYALGRLEGDDGRFFPRIEHIELDHEPPYLRMEYVDGRPLEELMFSPTAPLEERMALGLKILEALAAVHRHGYVHGDLSPLNVLITRAGEVKLIDVGYGAIFDDSAGDLRISGGKEEQEEAFGVASPLYAAPERFKAEFLQGCGKPADVFSFGKILYSLITGDQPFVIKPVSMKFRALGSAWDDYIFRCLEEKPEARFPDALGAVEQYRKLYCPEAKKGEFRAECPKCHAKISIPGGWAGERFPCAACEAMIEVLFYDDQSRHASTALAEPPKPAAEIEFLDEDPDVLVIRDEKEENVDLVITEAPSVPPGTRARKFCPRCGQSIYVEAKKCPHCRTWVDEAARKIVETSRRQRR